MINKKDLNVMVISIALLMVVFVFGCSEKKEDTIKVVSEFCTVSQVETDAVIECPNGTKVTLPAQTITETIHTITEVPVIIEIEKNVCRGHGHNHNENDDND